MKIYKDFASYNQAMGINAPLNNDIDIGYYDPKSIVLQPEPVMVDFYRISIKINYRLKSTPSEAHKSAIFFNSPDLIIPPGWEAEPTFTGMYLQLSKKVIEENRFLFRNYLDYGQHEALILKDEEVVEISAVFKLMLTHYHSEKKHFAVLLSYVNVMISLVESFYQRQFSTNPRQYNRIVADFQQALIDYYTQPVKQLPNVNYFADRLGLTANYLGDIIKHFTQKSALENIHEYVIKKAKEVLEKELELNTAEVAYQLGFEYPNYFAKFFKKWVGYSPKEYRLALNKKK
ncbi:helix-turn-helix domain-containing protein [Pedobacter sp. BMA]|uniref:helix-turn-helix domain-containing protein n=1 Tax=Pedobacter sp. BMA TaxID=1663685 RepID=UPI00069F1AA1|nr:helix-turn-helix domain-containing protein [Pedobacter sp. BMA]